MKVGSERAWHELRVMASDWSKKWLSKSISHCAVAEGERVLSRRVSLWTLVYMKKCHPKDQQSCGE